MQNNDTISGADSILPIKKLAASTVTLNETPLQCLDRSDIVSMAYATNRSPLSQEDL